MKLNPNDAPAGFVARRSTTYSCKGCSFIKGRCPDWRPDGIHSCLAHHRDDGLNVLFVLAPPKAPKCSVLFSNGKHCGLKATKATTVSPSLNSHWRALSQGITSLEILVCPRCHKLLKL